MAKEHRREGESYLLAFSDGEWKYIDSKWIRRDSKMLEQAREAFRKSFSLQIGHPGKVPLSRLVLMADRITAVELHLAATRDDRLKSLQNSVILAREIEAHVRRQFSSTGESPRILLYVEAWRLEKELNVLLHGQQPYSTKVSGEGRKIRCIVTGE